MLKDKKPASITVNKETIQQDYQLLQKIIETEGSIQIGLDHVDTDFTRRYPLLNKLITANGLDYHDVGKITGIDTDGENIFATSIECNNPEIEKMYLNGDFPAFSIVSGYVMDEQNSNDPYFVLKNLKEFKRVDFVNKGACKQCKVSTSPETGLISASLIESKLEDKNMSKKEKNDGNSQAGEGAAPAKGDANPAAGEGKPKEGEASASSKNGEGNNTEEEPSQFDIIQDGMDKLVKSNEIIIKLFERVLGKTNEGEGAGEGIQASDQSGEIAVLKGQIEAMQTQLSEQDVQLKEQTAKLGKRVAESKRSRVDSILSAAIHEGTVTSVEKEYLLNMGMNSDLNAFEEYIDSRGSVLDLNTRSRIIEASKVDEAIGKTETLESKAKKYGLTGTLKKIGVLKNKEAE